MTSIITEPVLDVLFWFSMGFDYSLQKYNQKNTSSTHYAK
jgi:hypothetical protein